MLPFVGRRRRKNKRIGGKTGHENFSYIIRTMCVGLVCVSPNCALHTPRTHRTHRTHLPKLQCIGPRACFIIFIWLFAFACGTLWHWNEIRPSGFTTSILFGIYKPLPTIASFDVAAELYLLGAGHAASVCPGMGGRRVLSYNYGPISIVHRPRSTQCMKKKPMDCVHLLKKTFDKLHSSEISFSIICFCSYDLTVRCRQHAYLFVCCIQYSLFPSW